MCNDIFFMCTIPFGSYGFSNGISLSRNILMLLLLLFTYIGKRRPHFCHIYYSFLFHLFLTTTNFGFFFFFFFFKFYFFSFMPSSFFLHFSLSIRCVISYFFFSISFYSLTLLKKIVHSDYHRWKKKKQLTNI